MPETEIQNGTVLNKETVVADENVIVLKKPYTFEGKEYNHIDLRGLENVTTADLSYCDAQVPAAIMPEMTLQYALLLASRVTGKPIEFFNQLPGRVGLQVKRTVMVFLNGTE